ncbi:hypothetical protein TrST_g1070 [Triparma strigata]|uniref:Uncharacterized protein n=1 Tax=Triparma strigata TaxID=1606541 RepID=A0A9W7A2Y9_9STRA|nr:hypothetical protein TrST_g1070 [Triparma strigata]
MMSADELDQSTITVVGFTGIAASVGVFVSDTYASLKAQNQRLSQSPGGQIAEQATEIEEPVEECSWVFVGINFFFALILSLLYLCYAVTLEDNDVEENALALALV